MWTKNALYIDLFELLQNTCFFCWRHFIKSLLIFFAQIVLLFCHEFTFTLGFTVSADTSMWLCGWRVTTYLGGKRSLWFCRYPLVGRWEDSEAIVCFLNRYPFPFLAAGTRIELDYLIFFVDAAWSAFLCLQASAAGSASLLFQQCLFSSVCFFFNKGARRLYLQMLVNEKEIHNDNDNWLPMTSICVF